MKDLVFTLSEKEFLDCAYYSFSHSNVFQIIQKKGRLAFLVLIFLIGGGLLVIDTFVGCLFLGVGILFFFFFKKYLIFYYKIRFKRLLKKEEYQKLIGQKGIIHFESTFLQRRYEHSEHKYDYEGFDAIYETQESFLIKFKSYSNLYLFFPKSQIDDVDELKTYFQTLCTRYTLKYIEDLDWTWK